MPLLTNLASLSQTPASNAADGSVDAPSTLDNQINLLASFLAQIRDGNYAGFNAWTGGSVPVAPSSGAFSNASAVIRYKLIGKTFFFSLVVTVVNNGTGAGSILVTMPFNAFTESAFGGRESQTAGWSVSATLAAGSSSLNVVKYDGTYPGANNYRIAINGVMETT